MISLKEVLVRILKGWATPPHPDGDLSAREASGDGDRRPLAHATQEDQGEAAASVEKAAPPLPKQRLTPPEREPFSALELRDRVVIMLLFDQIVTEKQVAEVWTLWQQEYRGDIKTPLWRLLTLVPELDRELILAEAARVYGIEGAYIALRVVIPAIKRIKERAPASLWEKMVDLRLMPIAETAQKQKYRMQTVFASHDPTHPEVKNLIAELGVDSYELRYASEYEIVALLAEAFPKEYMTLKTVLGEEKKHFEKVPEAEPTRDALPFVLEEEETVEESLAAWEEAPINSSSIISFFEELLVEAVRSGASGMCLVPSTNDKSEVYTLVDDALKPWCFIEHIPPELLFSTLESAIIRADLSLGEENQKQIIDRWIDGKRVRFRVSAVPAGALLDREAIVFRVLKSRRQRM